MIKLVALIMTFFFSGTIPVKQAENISAVTSLKWEKRVIVIFESVNQEKQIELFQNSKKEFLDRDMAIITVKENSNDFIKHFNGKSNSPSIYLIGKDGGLKFESDELVNPEVIYKTIDKMPMRIQEMNK